MAGPCPTEGPIQPSTQSTEEGITWIKETRQVDGLMDENGRDKAERSGQDLE